jgi:hypothetical protein
MIPSDVRRPIDGSFLLPAQVSVSTSRHGEWVAFTNGVYTFVLVTATGQLRCPMLNKGYSGPVHICPSTSRFADCFVAYLLVCCCAVGTFLTYGEWARFACCLRLVLFSSLRVVLGFESAIVSKVPSAWSCCTFVPPGMTTNRRFARAVERPAEQLRGRVHLLGR